MKGERSFQLVALRVRRQSCWNLKHAKRVQCLLQWILFRLMARLLPMCVCVSAQLRENKHKLHTHNVSKWRLLSSFSSMGNWNSKKGALSFPSAAPYPLIMLLLHFVLEHRSSAVMHKVVSLLNVQRAEGILHPMQMSWYTLYTNVCCYC